MKKWPRCKVHGCDNRVNPKRVAAGYPTCIELHASKAKAYTIVPVPKSNSVVGTLEDLKGISSSHKGTNPSALGSSDWWNRPEFVPKPSFDTNPKHSVSPRVSGISQELADKILSAQHNAGGWYVTGNLGFTEGYAKGLLTARCEPCRLTHRGEIVRHMLLNGQTHINVAELEG